MEKGDDVVQRGAAGKGPAAGPPPPAALGRRLVPATGLLKHNSWSPDSERDVTWERRRGLHRTGSDLRRGRSVTDDDLDELRGCLDLGFSFEVEPKGCAACGAGVSRLVQTFPALDLLFSVPVVGEEGCPSPPCACGASSETSSESPMGSPMAIPSPGDTPETVKMKLKTWAQVVALSLRNRS